MPFVGFGVLSVRGLEFRVDGVSGISGFRIGHPSWFAWHEGVWSVPGWGRVLGLRFPGARCIEIFLNFRVQRVCFLGFG